MGRAPCCEKVGLKRGRWTTEEDEILKNYIQTHGEGSWRSLPKNAGLLRCGKSCRLRWINYLRADVKRGNITPEEEDIIVKLHATMGNRWSLIAGHLSGRTDNEIKNYWNSHLSRKLHYFRKPSINTSANNQITFDFDASKTVATTPVLLPLRRRGGGRVSRAAMKKNKQLYNKSNTNGFLAQNKDNGVNNKVINNNATDTPTATAVLERDPKSSSDEMLVVCSPNCDYVADQDYFKLMCDDQVQVGPNNEVDMAVEDHCTRTQEMLCFDEMVDPHGILADQTVINGGIQGESCSTATSSQFGECGTLDWEWGLYNHDQFMVDDHGYDQLWMSMEEEGSTGSEKEQITSWLWDTTDDVSGMKEARQTSKELDSEERQEAMVAWLMS